MRLAEELRYFLGNAASAAPRATLPPAANLAGSPASATRPDSSGQPVRIVPKGLGSFNENDADFFLELLPGPRDRNGLPDSLRSWKTRIENTDPDQTFRVGLIYGPSGCGKSSLIKAGLIPRLEQHIVPIYVEAAAGDTEARLLKAIRKHFPALAPDIGLTGLMTGLRQGHGLERGEKVLVILDQFEQWLFGRKGDQSSELVAALRQCDGERVQTLCLVRDDFWMAVTRFLRDLEIDLVSDHNVSAVDLFDLRHARKVLEAYGRRHGTLPDDTRELTREHRAFLDQAVAGLAQENSIVPVRLALFAEMVKGRPWVPATLRDLGGMEGVGVKFLNDTFGSSHANPKHHYHQKGAQAVLRSLLPDANTDIKGRTRSIEELRHVCGYEDRPAEFAELIGVLDTDLRLITPVDPEGTGDGQGPAGEGTGRSYQLTHDYLVHSLRDWLTQKQRESRRGRAELRLATINSLWRDHPERRRLPSVLEWLDILVYTRSSTWSASERRMMRTATRHYAAVGFGVFAFLAILTYGILEYRSRLQGEGLVAKLRVAGTSQLPAIFEETDRNLHAIRPELERIAGDARLTPRERLLPSLALLPVDNTHDQEILHRVFEAEPDELIVLAGRLRIRAQPFVAKFWALAMKPDIDPKQKLRTAAALAILDDENPRWAQLAPEVANFLVRDENAFHLERRLAALRP